MDRSVVGEDADGSQQIYRQRLMLSVDGVHGARDQRRKQRQKRTDVNHLDSQGLCEGQLCQEPDQLRDVPDVFDVVLTSLKLQHVLQNAEQEIRNA